LAITRAEAESRLWRCISRSDCSRRATGSRRSTLDLDFGQRTLTHYVENRKAWAKETNLKLDIPNHRCFDAWNPDLAHNDAAAIAWLSEALSEFEPYHDFIVIDTPGGGGHVNLFAHGLADTLITPVNDSFLDLDVIFSTGSAMSPDAPSRYGETVRRAVEARRAITRRKTDWLVVRNRLMPLPSRNEREVHEALQGMAKKAGFRTATGLLERVVYREFFPRGLTAFDSLEASLLGVKPSMSHLLARQEVRQLTAMVRLAPTPDEREPWNPSRHALEPHRPEPHRPEQRGFERRSEDRGVQARQYALSA
jgi:chromosome partitioning protein